MAHVRSRIERKAARYRASGFYLLDNREIELRIGRELSRTERRALAIARDSRTNDDIHELKRQSSNRQAALRAALQVTHPSNAKGRSSVRTTRSNDAEYTTLRLPERGHTLRARYTDEANFSGNANERRLAGIVARRAQSRAKTAETRHTGVTIRKDGSIVATE